MMWKSAGLAAAFKDPRGALGEEILTSLWGKFALGLQPAALLGPDKNLQLELGSLSLGNLCGWRPHGFHPMPRGTAWG